MILKFAIPLLTVFTCTFAHAAPSLPSHVDRIAFGSCAKERLPQPLWGHIGAENPDVFLFIGDNNYADWYEVDGVMTSAPVVSRERFDEAYSTMAAIPEFAKFKTEVPILATWDDHDYGANDGGKDYPLKQQSQSAFLDFFGFADDDPIRQQSGIYQRYMLGETGKRVQIILLDTRFHRDDIDSKTDPEGLGRYIPTADTTRSMLGDKQWQWLEETLKEPAEIRIIASSIQVVAYQHGWETWGMMPHERQRLYDLVEKTEASGVLFLSGDRHLMEISKDTGQRGARVPYPMWDFTSSGMTDSKRTVSEPNDFRVSPVLRQTNYGVIDIGWPDEGAHQTTLITFTAKGPEGDVLTQHTISLDTLQIKH